jgi:hypothetical protein
MEHTPSSTTVELVEVGYIHMARYWTFATRRMNAASSSSEHCFKESTVEGLVS